MRAKRVEKLKYMHGNPVVRGLAEQPEDWPWSSVGPYATGIEDVAGWPTQASFAWVGIFVMKSFPPKSFRPGEG